MNDHIPMWWWYAFTAWLVFAAVYIALRVCLLIVRASPRRIAYDPDAKQFYFFGGFDGGSSRVYRYNPGEDTWTQMADMPRHWE